MQAPPIGRLAFSLHSCTSQDAEHPATELLHGSTSGRGWQSAGNCEYPQELVLALDRPCTLTQIQLLAHEFKIPTRVELIVGTPDPESPAGRHSAAYRWHRLGYLPFDSNERSSFQARELKSVHVRVPASRLRLVVHQCHPNRKNARAQVGLVAVNLVGEPLLLPPGARGDTFAPVQEIQQQQQPAGHHLHTPGSRHVSFLGSSGGGGDDAGSGSPGAWQELAGGTASAVSVDTAAAAASAASPQHPTAAAAAAMAPQQQQQQPGGGALARVDSVTAARIAEVNALKAAAVEAEDYDEAKRLKAQVDRLRAVGERIAALEARKAAAVHAEDYDLAKQLKAQIQAVRAAPDSALARGRSSSVVGGGDWREPSEQQQLRGGGGSDSSWSARRAVGGGAASGDANPQTSGAEQHANAALEQGGGGESAGTPLGGSAYDATYDDRPVKGRGSYALTEDDLATSPTPASSGRTPPAAASSNDSPSVPRADAPTGFPMDLPAPEPLSGAAAKDADTLIALAGGYVAAASASRTWQLREAALQHVERQLAAAGGLGGGEDVDPRDAYRALLRLALAGLKDKVANVLTSALVLVRTLVDCYGGAGAPAARDVASSLGDVLPLLVEKACDAHPRTRDGATALLLYLATTGGGGTNGGSSGLLHAHASVLLRPVKKPGAWRVVLGRLQLLYVLLPGLGVGDGASLRGALQLEPLMRFVGAAFGSANADVRSAAARLTAELGTSAGPSVVLRMLPAGLNAKLREQLAAAMASVEGAAADAADAPHNGRAASSHGAPPPIRRTASGSTGSAGGAGGAGGGGSTPQPAAAARRGSDHRIASSKPTPQAAARGGSAGSAASRHMEQAVACITAVATTGLAAMPGTAAEAEPLAAAAAVRAGAAAQAAAYDDPAAFESDIRQREAALGPDHPDVAEALSNLALLHSQNEDYGAARPLYERALAIHEKARGPSHPTVAHALTDLAVLHFEEGDEGAGRPLLERALAIQEAALGAGHPDALAIRDVLYGED